MGDFDPSYIASQLANDSATSNSLEHALEKGWCGIARGIIKVFIKRIVPIPILNDILAELAGAVLGALADYYHIPC
jgi:hypothetical protein